MLDRFLPRPAIREVHREAVASSVAHTYGVVRAIDLLELGLARRLYGLVSEGGGFQPLAEDAGHELVVGAVAKLWRLRIPFVQVAPDEFAAFDAAGYGKVAWSLRVDPREGGGAWVTFDLRVGATDARSRARVERAWQVVGRISHVLRRALMAAVVHRLGAVRDDEARELAGDTALPAAGFQKTLAITVEAPPSRVWPWLLELAARRAHDGAGVLALVPGRSMVIGDPRASWAFGLEPIGDDATRLTVRARAVVRPVMSAVHERIERRQLQDLKRRAEA